MPAFLSITIVSGTPVCSLSSIAVAPNTIKFFSMISAASSIFFSLFWMLVAAFLYVSFHALLS
jgi:hypothetical protein